ncbi:MAG TPA: DUF2142 domain-containing protein [Candidatus Kapabacteria bacterium]|nr:DUF2142 domain-containing protein [Candidatus Kapabacteria bacterium]
MKIPNIIKDINSLSPEIVFLICGVLFGLLMVYANPPYHSNDEDRHFYLAYNYSEGNLAPTVQNGKVGFILPISLYNITVSTQGKNYNAGQKVSRQMIDNAEKVPLNKDKNLFYEATTININPIAYIGPIIGMSVGKVINDNPIHILWAGRIGSLLFYLLIVYFAIKLIPFHKFPLTLIALNPMSLYQATSITYDTPIFALTLLLFAYTFKLLFDETTINENNIIMIVAIALIINFSKDGYFLLPFIALLLPMNRFKNKNLYYIMLASLIISIFIPNWTWGVYFQSLNLPNPKPLVSDFQYGGSEQINFLLSNPFGSLYNIFMNIITQGKEWMWGVFGRFGYSYSVLNKGLITVYGLFLFTYILLDNSGKYEVTDKQRYLLLSLGILTALMIIVGFYTVASPVGAKLIFGVQGRYFIPTLPFFIFALSNNIIKKEQFLELKGVVAISAIVIMLSYTVYFLDKQLWMN